jgi:hypothetical protein
MRLGISYKSEEISPRSLVKVAGTERLARLGPPPPPSSHTDPPPRQPRADMKISRRYDLRRPYFQGKQRNNARPLPAKLLINFFPV